MKKNVIFASLLACTFAVLSCNDQSNQSETTTNSVEQQDEDSKKAAMEANDEKFDTTKVEDDAEFVVKAADGGMFEVELGKVALKNASSAKVKELAQHIITDHTKANTELKAVASKKNITIPSTLSDKCQNKLNDLTKKKGEEFDKDYVDLMVKDHKEDIDLFEKEAENGNDAEIKAFASSKVPTLKHHLEMVQAIKDAQKK